MSMFSEKLPIEPFKIKVVEPIKKITQAERERILQKAGYNFFNIPAESIYIDLLTDSGTSAMSDAQWSRLMTGDESYAGAKSFFHLEKTARKIFGYSHIIPTHQGRAAERVLFQALVNQGNYVPNNIHFDTTRANIEIRGAEAVNLVYDDAYDALSLNPFKGNMDIEKLSNFILDKGKENIPLVILTITNNGGGGQPVSLKNIKDVSRICKTNSIPFFLDACRFAENSYFIKKREKEYRDKSILEIAQEIFSNADGLTLSAKKDSLVNIGGILALDDDSLAEKLKNLLIVSEGFPTYGGLAGRDLEAIARGLDEAIDEDYLEYRINQVHFLGNMLENEEIPVYKPVGGHAVYILADKFLNHIPRQHFPAWALCVELYRKFGIRAAEIGAVGFSKKDEKTKNEIYPHLELVRLAIPRRVYTASHLDYVAEATIDIFKNREQIKGMKLVSAPPYMRQFQARFETL